MFLFFLLLFEHLWQIYFGIVDESILYELLLKHELLLGSIWICMCLELAKRRFAWMKVSDELKMKPFDYKPNCLWLAYTPSGNTLFIYSTAEWYDENFCLWHFISSRFAQVSLGERKRDYFYSFLWSIHESLARKPTCSFPCSSRMLMAVDLKSCGVSIVTWEIKVYVRRIETCMFDQSRWLDVAELVEQGAFQLNH